MRTLRTLLCGSLLLPQAFFCRADPNCDAGTKFRDASNKAVALREVPADFQARYPSGEQTRLLDYIHDVMQTVQPKIQSAYRRALENSPHFNDKISVALALLPDGKIAAAEVVARTTAADDFEKEILDLIRPLDFGAGCGAGYYDVVRTLAFVSPADSLPLQPVSVAAKTSQPKSEWDQISALNEKVWSHWILVVVTVGLAAFAAALARWWLADSRT